MTQLKLSIFDRIYLYSTRDTKEIFYIRVRSAIAPISVQFLSPFFSHRKLRTYFFIIFLGTNLRCFYFLLHIYSIKLTYLCTKYSYAGQGNGRFLDFSFVLLFLRRFKWRKEKMLKYKINQKGRIKVKNYLYIVQYSLQPSPLLKKKKRRGASK